MKTNWIKKHKNKLIFVAALITPFGFVVLGAWKAYQMYLAKQNDKKPKTYEEFLESLRKDAEENNE